MGEEQGLDGTSLVNCWSSRAQERTGHQIGWSHFEASLLLISLSRPPLSFSPLASMNHSCLFFLPPSEIPLKKEVKEKEGGGG